MANSSNAVNIGQLFLFLCEHSSNKSDVSSGNNTTGNNANGTALPCNGNQSVSHGNTLPFGPYDIYAILQMLNNPSNLLPDPLSHGLVVTLIILYCLIIVLAVVGNSAVIFVIIKHKSRRSVTDVYILSLAVSDLLIATLNMPFQLYFVTANEWLPGATGEALCKFTNYVQGVTIVSCMLTLTAIAIDRYIVICRPSVARRFHSKKSAIVGICIVWLIAMCALSPHLVFQRLDKRLKITEHSNSVGWVCAEFYPRGKKDAQLYSVFIYVSLYCIPVLIMTYTYGAIAYRLWFKHPVFPANENAGQHARNIAHKKRITKLLIVLVLAYTVLWLPFFMLSMYHEFSKSMVTHFRVKRAVLQLVGYINCCVNPIMYTFLNSTFQREFFRLFRICFKNSNDGSRSCKTDTESKV